ncbi:S8 family serine peptidase [Jatrophihabitans sp. DSM 45814]
MVPRLLVSSVVASALFVSVFSVTATGSPAVGATVPTPSANQLPPQPASSVVPTRGMIPPKTGATTKIPRVAHLDPTLQQPSAGGPDAQVAVTVTGTAARIPAALKSVGSHALSSTHGRVTAYVPRHRLADLAKASGVSQVAPAKRAYSDAAPVTAESVAKSNASLLQAAGQAGAGVKVAIVDAGFSNLASEQTAGNLPTGGNLVLKNEDCTNANNQPSVDTAQHGTAVAEIIHQMAPQAQLYLYCVQFDTGFAQAGQDIVSAGDIKIVNSSLGFPADSRGGNDTGPAGSAVDTVHTARQAGVLWIESAGNSGVDHWGNSSFTTYRPFSQNGFNFVNLDGGSTIQSAEDIVLVPPSQQAEFVLQWNKWPTDTTTDVSLNYDKYQCPAATASNPCPNAGNASYMGTSTISTSPSGSTPVRDSGIVDSSPMTAGRYLMYIVYLTYTGALPAVRYDLTYWGDVSPNALSCLSVNGNGSCGAYDSRAYLHSITQPASSPDAMAVGAADVGTSSLEPFSSRGPNLDGSLKPDITAYDGVSSNLPEFGSRSSGGGFYGTSAAAPNVAGAAALVYAAHPTWTADELESYLEQSTTQAAQNNNLGWGLLRVVGTFAPAQYQSVGTPVRILDTRISGGGGPLVGTNVTRRVSLSPTLVPATATSVVINLTGIGATGNTYLSAYGSAFTGTSNLDLSKVDTTAAVAATVPIATDPISHDRYFTVLNSAFSVNVAVDLVGFFAPAPDAVNGFGALPPKRILDTRTANGGHQRQFANNETFDLAVAAAGVPDTATDVVINLTATGVQRANGYISAYPTPAVTTPPATPPVISTLDYTTYTRANLAVVGLSSATGPRTFTLRVAGAPVDVIVDVVGYFGGSSATSTYTALIDPVRMADTRNGTGGVTGARATNTKVDYKTAGRQSVPIGSTSVWTGVIPIPQVTGYVSLLPGGGAVPPSVSTVDFTKGRVAPNAAVTMLPTSGASSGNLRVYNSAGPDHIAVDIFGYFN